MAHQIFGDRFFGRQREPAWHHLGVTAEVDMGAMDALKLIKGDYITTLQPLVVRMPDGTEVPVPDRAIVRHPTPDDPEYVTFGVVGPDYGLITQSDVCQVWDQYVINGSRRRAVETIGVLRRGSLFFITSKLPAVDIRGDEVERYVMAVAPMDGITAATLEEVDRRVVCENTLRWAQAGAIQRYQVTHTSDAKEKMGLWLADAVSQAEANEDIIKGAFALLAGHQAEGKQAQKVINVAYPIPNPPRSNAPAEVIEKRMKYWTGERDRIIRYRTGAMDLFKGAGTGMDSPAAAGTMWGVYNAVVETEDYRKGWNRDGQEDQSVAESALFGLRARAKERAFDAALAIAQKG